MQYHEERTARQDQFGPYSQPTERMGVGQQPPTVPYGAGGYGVGPGVLSSTAPTEVIGGPPPTMAWLIIKNGPRAGRMYRLNPDVTSVGRDASNDIIIDDSAVSRQHAKVRVEKGEEGEEQFFIYDLATANGTIVNGEKIVKRALEDGDEVEIGRTTLVFKRIGPSPEEEEGEKAPPAGD